MSDDNEKTDPLALGNQLCFSVYSTAHAFTRLYRQLLEPFGLTYTQYVTLLALLAEDGLTVKALGHRLALDSGTLTPVLRRLEGAGYLLRTRDRRDERLLRVHLTERTHALRKDLEQVHASIAEATGLSQSELVRLNRRLIRLKDGLDAGLEARRQGEADSPTE